MNLKMDDINSLIVQQPSFLQIESTYLERVKRYLSCQDKDIEFLQRVKGSENQV